MVIIWLVVENLAKIVRQENVLECQTVRIVFFVLINLLLVHHVIILQQGSTNLLGNFFCRVFNLKKYCWNKPKINIQRKWVKSSVNFKLWIVNIMVIIWLVEEEHLSDIVN